MHVMARETWTDERLDDLAKRMDIGFSEVKEELRSNRAELKMEIAETRAELKGEIAATRGELKNEIVATRSEIGSLRTELKGDIDALSRKFDRLTITLIAALFGMVITHYLG